jgi:hypothetical protein
VPGPTKSSLCFLSSFLTVLDKKHDVGMAYLLGAEIQYEPGPGVSSIICAIHLGDLLRNVM